MFPQGATATCSQPFPAITVVVGVMDVVVEILVEATLVVVAGTVLVALGAGADVVAMVVAGTEDVTAEVAGGTTAVSDEGSDVVAAPAAVGSPSPGRIDPPETPWSTVSIVSGSAGVKI